MSDVSFDDLLPETDQSAAVAPPAAPDSGDLLEQAKRDYPILAAPGFQMTQSPPHGDNKLEFWPAGEEGTADRPRPKAFDLGKPGIEVFDKGVRPVDIMGDVASHYLKDNDPVVSQAYKSFESSLTPQQQSTLRDQYQWAQQNEGEKRPFDEWAKTVGLPAAFRGYLFDQWPKDFNDKFYTPEQRSELDKVMQYLKSQRPAPPAAAPGFGAPQ
jgi:hypothetical protein